MGSGHDRLQDGQCESTIASSLSIFVADCSFPGKSRLVLSANISLTRAIATYTISVVIPLSTWTISAMTLPISSITYVVPFFFCGSVAPHSSSWNLIRNIVMVPKRSRRIPSSKMWTGMRFRTARTCRHLLRYPFLIHHLRPFFIVTFIIAVDLTLSP